MNLQEWKFIIEFIYYIIAIIGIIILFWYTLETFKLRKIAQAQLIRSIRPFVNFLPESIPFVIKNSSNNVAINIFIVLFDGRKFHFKDDGNAVAGSIGPQQEALIKNEFFFETSKQDIVTKVEWLEPLLTHIENKKIKVFALIYDDLSGNHIYTLLHGSGGNYEQTSQTGYISEIVK